MSDRDPTELAKQLFRFLKAYSQKGSPVTRRASEHHWNQWLRELPEHPSISIGEVVLSATEDTLTGDGEQRDAALITIKRPPTTIAPTPPEEILDFVVHWRDPAKDIELLEARNVVREGHTVTERLGESPERVRALERWREMWNVWAEAERPARQAMKIFERFFELKGRIDRESERVELILGDGRLRWVTDKGIVDHPVLLQRVELEFDADHSEIRVIDTDREPELYTDIIHDAASIPPARLNEMRSEVRQGGYHPLAREGTNAFLRRLVQTLAAGGVFEDSVSSRAPGPQPAISREPVLFLRNRASGFPAAFDRVLEDLERDGTLPASLSRLVGVEPELPPKIEVGEWSPWGEPPDILLSKPANEEQIRIARALDHHKAILVQGPPGTGKSHTIANLVGHLVAHGKRVLITSHTTKALRVLRGHIVDTIRPLCVALLDNDLEGRGQMEEAVKGILSRLIASSETAMERELSALVGQRVDINHRIASVTADLRAVREAEYLPILVGGESTPPSEGSRWVKSNAEQAWIPGPVQAFAPLPLSVEELRELYDSNGVVTREQEADIAAGPAPLSAVPPSATVSSWVNAIDSGGPGESGSFWKSEPAEADIPDLERLVEMVNGACAHLSRLEPWQRAVVSVGHRGGADVELWAQLATLIDDQYERAEKAKAHVLQHDPALPPAMGHDDAARIAKEIDEHLQRGGSIGTIGLLLHPEWKGFLQKASCNGKAPASPTSVRALRIWAELSASRVRLGARWAKQAELTGLPRFESFGSEPEAMLREYASQFGDLLAWWDTTWPDLLASARTAGFHWEQFRASEVARTGPSNPFDRDVQILNGPLREAIRERLAACRKAAAIRLFRELEENLARYGGIRTAAIRRSLRTRDVVAYETARDELQSLMSLVPIVERRAKLLAALEPVAPSWSNAIRRRDPDHGASLPSADVGKAWRWRQLRQEIDRRAELDEIALSRTLHQLRDEMRRVTANVIDRRAWLGQIRRIDLTSRQALQGWADIQRRIGRGTGRRVPALQAEARTMLTKARDAVPVWIMPLARVAESFDPTKVKFDVVIIDEASQSDVTGLLAWYLGDRVAVVGDHEQVSPLAVGQRLENVEQLIAQHLVDVPNAVLYDGKLSLYDLARQSFGGTIALREHFRCVPEIIDFSNYLSYAGEIRPLRDPTRAPGPYVVEHVVSGARSLDGKRNVTEARTIVAIMKALTELPRYRGASMGAISLLGDEQASLIQEIAVQVLGAVELSKSRFAAGNAAQFQGDERDVMFLSMVDSSTGQTLRLRQDDTTKQRYNVAASRARDQLWLIHSLDPAKDLQQSDLRYRLIEHMREPNGRRMAVRRAQERAESPFERSVLERLIAEGFRSKCQVWVGEYRIDIVVADDHGQVAIECDGDRFHGVDQIPADMARQAILERAGWRFIRIRGTRFYRDPEETMAWVFSELARLDVRRSATLTEDGVQSTRHSSFRDDVVRRAWEIMREREWIEPIQLPSLDANDARD